MSPLLSSPDRGCPERHGQRQQDRRVAPPAPEGCRLEIDGLPVVVADIDVPGGHVEADDQPLPNAPPEDRITGAGPMTASDQQRGDRAKERPEDPQAQAHHRGGADSGSFG